MTIIPEFGEEERMNQQQRRVREASASVQPLDHDDIAEHEIADHLSDERVSAYLEAEDNEARAPGAVCERCAVVITANEDARRLPDGNWVHEVCPRAVVKIST